MNGVVDAVVIGRIAAGHAAVGGVDNRIVFQRGNVALPEVSPRLNGRKTVYVGYALFGNRLTQIFILNFQEFRIGASRRTHVQQPTQQPLLIGCAPRNAQPRVSGFSSKSDRIKYSRRSD